MKTFSVYLSTLVLASLLAACGGGFHLGITAEDKTPRVQSPKDSGSKSPGDQNPDNQDPGNQNPGNQDPGNQNPGNQNPGGPSKPDTSRPPVDLSPKDPSAGSCEAIENEASCTVDSYEFTCGWVNNNCITINSPEF